MTSLIETFECGICLQECNNDQACTLYKFRGCKCVQQYCIPCIDEDRKINDKSFCPTCRIEYTPSNTEIDDFCDISDIPEASIWIVTISTPPNRFTRVEIILALYHTKLDTDISPIRAIMYLYQK